MGFNEPQLQLQAFTSEAGSSTRMGLVRVTQVEHGKCNDIRGPMRARKCRLAVASGHSHAGHMLSDSGIREATPALWWGLQ
jgi:hypothetical protein